MTIKLIKWNLFFLHSSNVKGYDNRNRTKEVYMVSIQPKKAVHPISLKFDKKDEKVFFENTFQRQLKMVRFAFLFAMLLFVAFGILDYFLFPKEIKSLFTVRYMILMPVAFIASVITFTRFFRYIKEGLTFSIVIFSGILVIFMNILVAEYGIFNVHYAGLLLTFVFCYTFSKLQFIWASMAGGILVILYNVAFIWIHPIPLVDIFSANFILIALNVLGMIACYWIEFYTRMAYLSDEALRYEKEKIEAINFTLEEKIHERTKSLMQVNKSLQEEIQIRVMAEREKQYYASHDELTSLINRRVFSETIEQKILAHQAKNKTFGIIYIDLDKFKEINDSIGHLTGDTVLTVISGRLKDFFGSDVVISRLGGDEFSLVIEDYLLETDLIASIETLLETISKNIVIGAHKISIHCSIGISFYPEHGQSSAQLIKHAEAAMTRAKSEGGNRVRIFNALLADEINERLYLSNKLRMAAEYNQLFMVYQPKICAKTGLIAGVEALMRWHLPEKGLIPPDRFIPLAESTGLIHEIGEWMIERVCKDLHTMPERIRKKLTVNINLSALEFSEKEIVNHFKDRLKAHNMKASTFCIEITESTMMVDMDGTLKKLEAFKDMGAKIAIDDFGTGYSSLSYLSKLPIDELKIDRSFVQKIGQSIEDEHIIRTIAALAKNLNMRIVSEGVENEAQVSFLRQLEVDELQGYFFARPLTLEDLSKYILQERAFVER